jgi:hypothetical protein
MADDGQLSRGQAVAAQVANDTRALASKPDYEKSSARLYVEGGAKSLAFDFSAPMLHMMHGAYTNDGGEFALGAGETVLAAGGSVVLGKTAGAAGEWAIIRRPGLARPVWGDAPLNLEAPLGVGGGPPKPRVVIESPSGDGATPVPQAGTSSGGTATTAPAAGPRLVRSRPNFRPKPGRGGQPGSRPSEEFTHAGKDEVLQRNAASEPDGVAKCANPGCRVELEVPAQSRRGVTPSGREAAVDHKVPRSRGGSGDPSNGQGLCRTCNTKASNKPKVWNGQVAPKNDVPPSVTPPLPYRTTPQRREETP